MDTNPSASRKSRTLVKAQRAAHSVAANAARDVLFESPLMQSIARFEQTVLRRGATELQLRVLEDLRGERDRLRRVPSNDTARDERLRRLDPIEIAVRSGPDGESLRRHFFTTVWVAIRDQVEDEIVRFTDLLQSDLERTRREVEDVVEASRHLNHASEQMIFEKGVISPADGSTVFGTNWTAGAWLDATRSLVNVGERLLEAVQSARVDAVGEDCHAWCGFFVVRALSVLKSGHGERICELIDKQHKTTATPTANAVLENAQKAVAAEIEPLKQRIAEQLPLPAAATDRRSSKDAHNGRTLTGWKEILPSIGQKYNRSARRRINDANAEMAGPIYRISGRKTVYANEGVLMSWWNQLEDRHAEGATRSEPTHVVKAKQVGHYVHEEGLHTKDPKGAHGNAPTGDARQES